MTDYQIAIPSFKRPARAAKLLARLAEKGIPLDNVTLFLHESDPSLDDYASLTYVYQPGGIVINDEDGVRAQRQLISRHYDMGTHVLCMDDDVNQVIYRRPAPLNRTQLPEWDSLFRRMFEELETSGLYVMGVKSTTNIAESAMGQRTDGLRFAIGTLYGFISRPGHPVHDIHVAVKEDYELSLRAYKYDGGLLRFEDIGVDADHYGLPGGCVDWRTDLTSFEAAMYLMENYPGLVRWNKARAAMTGHPEISLVRKERNTDAVL